MKDLSEEERHQKALNCAPTIKKMNELSTELDVEYLQQALKDMRHNLDIRRSAMILDPDPHTAIERSELQEAKLQQLECMIKLATTSQKIKNAERNLSQAHSNKNQLNNFFGI